MDRDGVKVYVIVLSDRLGNVKGVNLKALAPVLIKYMNNIIMTS